MPQTKTVRIVTLIWWLNAVLVLFGSAFISLYSNQRIFDIQMKTALFQGKSLVNDAAAGKAFQLQFLERRARADVARMSPSIDFGAALLKSLLALAQAARTEHATVVSVTPNAKSSGRPSEKMKLPEAPSLAIEMVGSFENILHVVQELPRHSLLNAERLQIRSLGSKDRKSLVKAVLDGQLYVLPGVPAAQTSS